jgi:hypothetical protein
VATEAGEFIVGAYLQFIYRCGVVLYNVPEPGGKLKGLNELDVLGLNLKDQTAYLCEVTTHLHGMRPNIPEKLSKKHERQRAYAKAHLGGFKIRYMLWSPLVSPKELGLLQTIDGLELVVNATYSQAVMELRKIAKTAKYDTGNPFMRTLQILEHLKVC